MESEEREGRLSDHGEPVAETRRSRPRPRWLSGPQLLEELRERSADPALARDLDEAAGQTIRELSDSG